MAYVVSITEVGLTDRKGAPRHRFVEAFWTEERPYPEDAYPTHNERAVRLQVEKLMDRPGIYLVVVIDLRHNPSERLPDKPVTFSWTVTVAPPILPPPPVWRSPVPLKGWW